jgi:hypothetical protein
MIISVTQIVVFGDKRVEKTASATLDNRGLSAHLRDLTDREGATQRYREQLTNTSRALFESLGE